MSIPEYSNYIDADIFLSERVLPGNSLERPTTRLADIARDLKEQIEVVERESGVTEYRDALKLQIKRNEDPLYGRIFLKEFRWDPCLLKKRNRLAGRSNAVSGVVFQLWNHNSTHHIINQLRQREDFLNDYDPNNPFDEARVQGIDLCLSILKHVHKLDMVDRRRVTVTAIVERFERGKACPAVEIGDSLCFKGRHTGKVYPMVIEALYPTPSESNHCMAIERLRMILCDDGVWRYPYDSISVNCNTCSLMSDKVD